MKFDNYKSFLASNLHQIPGWRTNRRIVVIESDDWGSIRIPSNEVYRELFKKGLKIDDYYNRNDSLATEHDLEELFAVLTLYKDRNGKNPVITANCLVANPDFERIKEDDFQNYYFETFTETLKKQKDCQNSFNLWKEGIKLGIFKPQFHGREHLNVALWMAALAKKHGDTHLAFKYGFWGHETNYPDAKRKHFMAAYDFNINSQLKGTKEIIKQGLQIFEDLFGYRSDSAVAPNFIWDPEIESTFSEYGVKYIQSQRKQFVPINNSRNYRNLPHYIGQRNSNSQIFLVRNAIFEPSSNTNIDWVSLCLRNISNSFFWKKPALISTHRVNFIGSIISENRKKNLTLFAGLLKEIIRRWPDVEFKSTDQLGEIILTD